MAKRLFLKAMCAALMATAGIASTSVQAAGNILINGDFETLGFTFPGNFQTLAGGDSTSLPGWVVGLTSVDVILNDGLTNPYGAITGYSVDLSGTPGPGSVSQTFFATAGEIYDLSFDYWGNFAGGAIPGQLNFTFFGQTSQITVNPLAAGIGAGATFTATTTGPQTLTFFNPNQSNSGPTIDNVVLTAVPEPEGYALMLGGLVAMGAITRLRSR